ncbi:60S ribosomal protein L21-B like [Verticillium longisporum]|uniref:60S ribosomal protein L21-B like n=1 Tax=Verticillium longisporum TaxID=100787 RepID=A0A8I2ZJZ4_VERLO|nr:60S ribosomal protein L21-B like [Verticillium longisporum]
MHRPVHPRSTAHTPDIFFALNKSSLLKIQDPQHQTDDHPSDDNIPTRWVTLRVFARVRVNFRQKGMIKLSTYLRQYRVGDIVDIKANGAVQKGMPHKVYHGKTGVVYNVSKSAVGIIIYKKVKHRYIEKRINIRVEHISPSRSRDDFLRRVKENARLRKEAQAEGKTVLLKRLPAAPRDAHTISLKENVPETVTPLAYETTI